jgi:hypothetical protein
LISKYVDLRTEVKFVPRLISVLMAMDVQDVRSDREVIEDSADCLKDIVVGAEEVVSWRLGIDCAVDVFYNTVVVDGDLERRWVGVSVIRKSLKKFLYPCEP